MKGRADMVYLKVVLNEKDHRRRNITKFPKTMQIPKMRHHAKMSWEIPAVHGKPTTSPVVESLISYISESTGIKKGEYPSKARIFRRFFFTMFREVFA